MARPLIVHLAAVVRSQDLVADARSMAPLWAAVWDAALAPFLAALRRAAAYLLYGHDAGPKSTVTKLVAIRYTTCTYSVVAMPVCNFRHFRPHVARM